MAIGYGLLRACSGRGGYVVRQRVALSVVGVLLLFGVSTGVAGAQTCSLSALNQAPIVETARFFGVDLSIAEAIFCGRLAAASPPIGGGGGTPPTTTTPGVTTTTTRPTTTTTVRASTTTTAPSSPTTTVAAGVTVPAPRGVLSSALARTGGDILGMVVASGGLMVIGLVLVARTRRSQAVKGDD